MSLATLIPLALKISVALNVLGLGLRTTPSDAAYLVRRPGLFVRSMLSLYVIMPLFAVALALMFDLRPAVKIALVTLSVSPIPPLLPKKQLKAGGKHDYIIGLLVTASVLATIVIPVTIKLVGDVFGLPMQMSAGAVALLVLKTILAPLLLGIALRMAAPEFAQRASSPVMTGATVLLLLSLIPVLFSQRQEIFAVIGNGTLLALLAFSIVGLGVGHLLGGMGSENQPVLALSTASRHPGMAAAIVHANFPQQRQALSAILLFLIINAIISKLYISLIKRHPAGAETDTEKQAA